MTESYEELQNLYKELGELESVRRKTVLWKLVFFRKFFHALENDLWNSLPFLYQKLVWFITMVLTIMVPSGFIMYILSSSLGTQRLSVVDILLSSLGTQYSIVVGVVLVFVLFFATLVLSGIIMRKAINPELNKRFSKLRSRIAEIQNHTDN